MADPQIDRSIAMRHEITRYGHIPALALDDGVQVEVGLGELRAVPWEEFYELEGLAVAEAERKYKTATPVFFVDRIHIEDEEGIDLKADLFGPLDVHMTRLYFALCFAVAASLPSPSHSNWYFWAPGTQQLFTRQGDRHRDWIIGGLGWKVGLPPEREGLLRSAMSGLERLDMGDATPELLRILETIGLATEPTLTEADVIVHLTMAVEDVVNPDADRPLAEVFAQRAAGLTIREAAELSSATEMYREIYRVRNALLHGKDPTRSLDRLGEYGQGLMGLVLNVTWRLSGAIASRLARDSSTGTIQALVADCELAVAGTQDDLARFLASRNVDWLATG